MGCAHPNTRGPNVKALSPGAGDAARDLLQSLTQKCAQCRKTPLPQAKGVFWQAGGDSSGKAANDTQLGVAAGDPTVENTSVKSGLPNEAVDGI